MADNAPILQLEKVEVVYHDVVTAIHGIALAVPEGAIVALMGGNGAGKTTTLRAISGFIGLDHAKVTEGRVLLAGDDITNAPPHVAAARGVALVPERDKVFEMLSVKENLDIAARQQRATAIDFPPDRAFDYFPALARLRHRQAGYLSGGERQMLALGAALVMSPRLLLVDELSLGLAPLIVAELVATLVQARDEMGLSILLVEQNAEIALDVADYGYVIENGRVVLDGDAARLKGHQDVQEFYLGQVGRGERRSYRDVKQYRRSRRWYG